MTEREGDCLKAFVLPRDEEGWYLVGLREIVFGDVSLLIEENGFWEGFRGLRDREGFNREGEERAFSDAKTFPTFLRFARESARAATVFWAICLTGGLRRG